MRHQNQPLGHRGQVSHEFSFDHVQRFSYAYASELKASVRDIVMCMYTAGQAKSDRQPPREGCDHTGASSYAMYLGRDRLQNRNATQDDSTPTISL